MARMIDTGFRHAIATIKKRPDGLIYRNISKVFKLPNETKIYTKGILPAKLYGTKGLTAPQNPNYCTLEFWSKLMKERYDVVEGEFVRKVFEPRSHQKDSGIPMPGLAKLSAEAFLTYRKVNLYKMQDIFMKLMSEKYTVFQTGNMTYNVERKFTTTASEALVDYEAILKANDIRVTGDTCFSLLDSTFQLLDKEKVILKKYDKFDGFANIEVSKETFRKLSFCHDSKVKTEEKGTADPRSIVCISTPWKVITHCIEAMAKAALSFVKNEVITVGGAEKDAVIKDILLDEKFLPLSNLLNLSEDKSGWNRQIQALVLAPMYEVLTRSFDKRNKDAIMESVKCLKYKWTTLKPFKIWSEDKETWNNKFFHELTWDNLNERYQKLFFNSEKIFKDLQKDFESNHKLGLPYFKVEDCMFMGIIGCASTVIRAASNSLYNMMLPAIFKTYKGGKYKDCKFVSRMICSSDDSMNIHGSNAVESTVLMHVAENTLDNYLCMQLSSKKTGGTRGDPLVGCFGEFTTDYYLGVRKRNPGNKVLTKSALLGRSAREEVGNICSFPAVCAEESNMDLAMFCGVFLIDMLSTVNKISLADRNNSMDNHRRKFLTAQGIFGMTPLHGEIPALDLVSACSDPFTQGVFEDPTKPTWIMAMNDTPVVNPHKEALPMKWGVKEEVDQMSFATIYGAPVIGTKRFLKTAVGSDLSEKKIKKGLYADIMNAEMVISPNLAFLQNSNLNSVSMLISGIESLENTVHDPELIVELDLLKSELNDINDEDYRSVIINNKLELEKQIYT